MAQYVVISEKFGHIPTELFDYSVTFVDGNCEITVCNTDMPKVGDVAISIDGIVTETLNKTPHTAFRMFEAGDKVLISCPQNVAVVGSIEIVKVFGDATS